MKKGPQKKRGKRRSTKKNGTKRRFLYGVLGKQDASLPKKIRGRPGFLGGGKQYALTKGKEKPVVGRKLLKIALLTRERRGQTGVSLPQHGPRKKGKGLTNGKRNDGPFPDLATKKKRKER